MFTMITADDRQHMQYMQHVLLQIHFTSEIFEDEIGKRMGHRYDKLTFILFENPYESLNMQ